jgi:hypothetical protein
MSATAPVTSRNRHPYREYGDEGESRTPLLDALAREQEATAAAEAAEVAAEEREVEKVRQARIAFAREYKFPDADGEPHTYSGTVAVERAYCEYLNALNVAETAHANLVNMLPSLKHAHRILADAGEDVGAFPEPVGLKMFHAV